MQDLDAETEAEGWRMLFIGLLSLLSQSPQDHLPRNGTAYSRLGPSPSITNQENAPQGCLQDDLMGTFFQLSFLFSDDSNLCQLDKKLTKTASKFISLTAVTHPLSPWLLYPASRSNTSF